MGKLVCYQCQSFLSYQRLLVFFFRFYSVKLKPDFHLFYQKKLITFFLYNVTYIILFFNFSVTFSPLTATTQRHWRLLLEMPNKINNIKQFYGLEHWTD